MEEWDALALRPVAEGATAADLMREKYHLFPGLNWRVRGGTKDIFIDWLQRIDSPGKVLIFDTGTEGNAPRQIFRLIQERLPQCDTRSPLEFEIVGIVDGDNPKSVPDIRGGRSRNGNPFLLTVEYITIGRVLSEDFQSLVGYRKLDTLGYLEPLRDIGIVRLVNDEGRVVQITATDNLSNVFRGYMTNAVGGPERLARKGREVLTPDVERAMVEEVLDYAQRGELSELQNAWSIGLLPDRAVLEIRQETQHRYREERAEYPRHVWSFLDKMIQIRSAPLYAVLREVARKRELIGYTELSERYYGLTGDRPNPRKAWEAPLGELNGAAADAGLPPLAAVVVCRAEDTWPGTEAGLPAEGFWGSPGVPPWPPIREERKSVWREILDSVHRADWPESIPGLE